MSTAAAASGKAGQSGKDKVIVILGPTASGKTALSLDLAERLGTEIISGDSMLVYKGFDIGTAKPTLEERRGIRHHLIDILEPAQVYSVTQFQQQAGTIIRELNAEGRIPIIAGGTGLYLKALLEDYTFNETGEHQAFREEMRAFCEREGREALYARLVQADPRSAKTIHAHNIPRVIRALEVAYFGGEQISRSRAYDDGQELAYDAFVVGLAWERPALYARINRRVDLMMEAGLEQEVRTLLDAHVTREMPAMKGIGYKEMAAYLAGEWTREDAIDAIKKGTRHFAKRQLTWYRKMPYIHWYALDDCSEQELFADVLQDLAGFWPKESNLFT
ncbi:MAG: tRNA (adenosine(37)-N6)-dimethylallyltransferase MiaA [Selenomonadaceae bacterium]|nr:tRNA (adenosine(37)-N6)-dimethylallyltransferase MiaA [Selenomonadaceae bacterium]